MKYLIDNQGHSIATASAVLKGKPPKIKPRKPTKVPTGFDQSLNRPVTVNLIVKACGVTPQTARRYIREKVAPPMARKLIDLFERGRILPESWKYCFINPLGNLEIYQMGEISENDILNIDWSRTLYLSRIRTLEKDIENANNRIKQLEHALTAARQQLSKRSDIIT